MRLAILLPSFRLGFTSLSQRMSARLGVENLPRALGMAVPHGQEARMTKSETQVRLRHQSSWLSARSTSRCAPLSIPVTLHPHKAMSGHGTECIQKHVVEAAVVPA
jgi:hypothetical protein